MNIGQAFASKYLKASDVPEDHPVTVRIDRVELEDVGQGKDKETKPVLYFTGKQKGMVLNKTNSKTIAKAYSEETDNWIGKAVQIISTEVEYQGDMVPALRIRIPKAAPANNGGGQGSPVPAAVAARGAEVRNRPAPEPPFSEEDSHFNVDDIQF